jgi:hypothetical protein
VKIFLNLSSSTGTSNFLGLQGESAVTMQVSQSPKFAGYQEVIITFTDESVLKKISERISIGEHLCTLACYFNCGRFIAFFIWMFAHWRTADTLWKFCSKSEENSSKFSENPKSADEINSAKGSSKFSENPKSADEINLIKSEDERFEPLRNIGAAMSKLLRATKFSGKEARRYGMEKIAGEFPDDFSISKNDFLSLQKYLYLEDGDKKFRTSSMTPDFTAFIGDQCLDKSGNVDVDKCKCFFEILSAFECFTVTCNVLKAIIEKPELINGIESMDSDFKEVINFTSTREMHAYVFSNAIMPFAQYRDGNCGIVAALCLIQSNDPERMFLDFKELIERGQLCITRNGKINKYKFAYDSKWLKCGNYLKKITLQVILETTAMSVLNSEFESMGKFSDDDIMEKFHDGTYGINPLNYTQLLMAYLGDGYGIKEEKIAKFCMHNDYKCDSPHVIKEACDGWKNRGQTTKAIGCVAYMANGAKGHFVSVGAGKPSSPLGNLNISPNDSMKNIREKMLDRVNRIREMPFTEIFTKDDEVKNFLSDLWERINGALKCAYGVHKMSQEVMVLKETIMSSISVKDLISKLSSLMKKHVIDKVMIYTKAERVGISSFLPSNCSTKVHIHHIMGYVDAALIDYGISPVYEYFQFNLIDAEFYSPLRYAMYCPLYHDSYNEKKFQSTLITAECDGISSIYARSDPNACLHILYNIFKKK